MEISRTKIIATVGPSCSTLEIVQSLVDQGVNCFRVNLSHGTAEDKQSYFDLIKSTHLPSGGRPAILGDLGGHKIRVSGLESDYELKEGDVVTISNEEMGKNVIPVSKGVKFQKIDAGAQILINEGRIALEVVKYVSNSTLECQTIIAGAVENRKGVNFPGVALDVPSLTEQEQQDLELALKMAQIGLHFLLFDPLTIMIWSVLVFEISVLLFQLWQKLKNGKQFKIWMASLMHLTQSW